MRKRRGKPRSPDAALNHASGETGLGDARPYHGAAVAVAAARRPRVVVMLGLSLATLAIVLLGSAWLIARDAAHTRDLAERSGANALLAAQQLDAVFDALMEGIPQDEPLSDLHAHLLRTWLRFDERYLAENAHNLDTRFERAVAHRRFGHGLQLLGDLSRAQAELQQAIVLFEQLSAEHPTVASYVGERADTYVRLGWTAQRTNDFARAAEVFQRAATLLEEEARYREASLDPYRSFDPRLIDACIHDNLASAAMQRGAANEVLSHLEQSAAISRQLAAEFPESPGYRRGLVTAEAKLESARRQFAQP